MIHTRTARSSDQWPIFVHRSGDGDCNLRPRASRHTRDQRDHSITTHSAPSATPIRQVPLRPPVTPPTAPISTFLALHGRSVLMYEPLTHFHQREAQQVQALPALRRSGLRIVGTHPDPRSRRSGMPRLGPGHRCQAGTVAGRRAGRTWPSSRSPPHPSGTPLSAAHRTRLPAGPAPSPHPGSAPGGCAPPAPPHRTAAPWPPS